MFEDLSCLLVTSDSSEGVDIPQCAYGEGYCRGAEVVWGRIAEDMKTISEPLLHGRNGAEEARIRRGEIAKLLRDARAPKQTVEVRHVHIHSGGQGVVGIIIHPTIETRVCANETRTHAPGRHRTIWPNPGGVGREREPEVPSTPNSATSPTTSHFETTVTRPISKCVVRAVV